MFKWSLQYQIFSQICAAPPVCDAKGEDCLEQIMPGIVSEASAAAAAWPGLSVNPSLSGSSQSTIHHSQNNPLIGNFILNLERKTVS